MPKKNQKIAWSVMILLAVTALFAGLFFSKTLQKKAVRADQLHGTLLEQPRVIKPFSLMGTDHQVFDDHRLKGTWTFVFFGFTHCGYVCPTTMAELAKMHQILEQKGVKHLPQVVMISVDPKRDSLTLLKQYVTSFNPHFYGARGDEHVIKKLAKELGIAYLKFSKPGADTKNDYDIEHTGTIMLFNPQGELSAFFTTPHHAEALAADFLLLN